MSDTLIDMAKVTQMLDNGWSVDISRNEMGTYTASGFHPNGRVRDRLEDTLRSMFTTHNPDIVYDRDWDWTEDERLETDDFTPEQALTRLAYKVHGEII